MSDVQRVRYLGVDVPELSGQWVEIPAGVPLYAAESWIIQNLGQKKQSIEPSPLEQPAGEIDEGANTPGASAENFAELDRLREELAELHERLDDPNTQRHTDTIAAVNRTIQSGWDLSKELRKLEADAEAAAKKNADLVASAEIYHREVESERKKISGLTKANQKIMNQAFTSYAEQIKDLRKTMAEAQLEIGQLKTDLKDSRKQLDKANKIIAAWDKKEAEKNG